MKPRRYLQSLCLLGKGACVLFIQISSVAGAGTLYWDTNGATAGSGTTATNWTTTVWTADATGSTATSLYVQNSDVVFSAGTNATGGYTVNISEAQSANSLTFKNGTVTMSAVSGGTLSIGTGGINMSAGLNGNVNIGGTLGAITLLGSQTWTNSTTGTSTTRALTVGNTSAGTLVGAEGQNVVLTLAGTSTGTTFINSELKNGAGGTLAIVKGGSGILTLGRANTFTGGVTLESGTLNLSVAGALGTGTLLVKGGMIGNGSIAPLTLSNPVQTWDGDFGFSGSQNLNMGTGSVTLTGNRTIAINGNLTSGAGPVFTIGGVIGGAFGLTTTNATAASKGIAGILELTAENTYSGGTTINGGVVRFASETAVPDTGVIKIENNGALSVSGVHTTLASWLGDSRLATTSTGALALTADSAENFNPTGFNGLSLGAELGKTVNYSGTITASTAGYFIGGGGGTLVLANANALTGSSNLTIGNGGSGTVLFNQSNDYTGVTTVKAGSSVRAANAGALGSAAGGTVVEAGGNISLEGGVVVTGEALTLNGTSSTASPGNYIAGLSNGGGDNEWGGNISAVLSSGNNVRLTSNTGSLLVSGNVALSGSTGAGSSLVLTGASPGSGTVSGVISGTVPTTAIIKNGTSTWTLSGVNTFTGAVRVDDGLLKVDSIANNLGKGTGSIGFGEATATGTLVYTGGSETTARGINLRSLTTGGGTIDQSGTGALVFSGGVTSTAPTTTGTVKTLTLQGSTAGTGEIAGAIANGSNGAATLISPTSVVKAGTGMWTLSGTSSYTGTTTVNGGTLNVTGKLNATTALNVSNGTLVVGQTDAVNANATVTLGAGAVVQIAGFNNSFAALTLSNGNAVLDLSGGNSLVTFGPSSLLAWTGTLSIKGWSGTPDGVLPSGNLVARGRTALAAGGGAEQVNFTGGLTISQTSAITFDNPEGYAPGIYSSKFIGTELVPDVLIPEPSALVLLMAGTIALGARRRRN